MVRKIQPDAGLGCKGAVGCRRLLRREVLHAAPGWRLTARRGAQNEMPHCQTRRRHVWTLQPESRRLACVEEAEEEEEEEDAVA